MYASLIILLLTGMISTSLAYQPRRPLQQKNMPSCSPSDDATHTRRSVVLKEFPAFAAVMMAGMMVSSSSRADALDYDSFMNKELNNEAEKPKMSEDEALCRFGSPSQKTGNACLQAGLSTKRPTGVDAFGTVDRECCYSTKIIAREICFGIIADTEIQFY